MTKILKIGVCSAFILLNYANVARANDATDLPSPPQPGDYPSQEIKDAVGRETAASTFSQKLDRIQTLQDNVKSYIRNKAVDIKALWAKEEYLVALREDLSQSKSLYGRITITEMERARRLNYDNRRLDKKIGKIIEAKEKAEERALSKVSSDALRKAEKKFVAKPLDSRKGAELLVRGLHSSTDTRAIGSEKITARDQTADTGQGITAETTDFFGPHSYDPQTP